MGNLFDVHHILNNSISWKTWLINGGGNIEETFNNRVVILMSVFLLLFERKINSLAQSNKWRLPYVVTMLTIIIVWGAFGNVQKFIYLQF